MSYPSPKQSDLDDVAALNQAFLDELAKDQFGNPALKDRQIRQRLADCPCLLYRLAGHDPAYWQRLFERRHDLLDAARPTAARWNHLVSATLGFLWHLGRRDPHAARLFSGESHAWFAALSSMQLVHLTHGALASGLEPELRYADDDPLWFSLLAAAAKDNRRELEMIAMRSLHLALAAREESLPARSAACRRPSPTRQLSSS